MFGIALLVAANIYSYLRVIPPCCDFFGPFGVPFEMGGYGGFAGQTYILWRGVLANVLVALFVGIIIGLACRSLLCIGTISGRVRKIGRASAA